MATPTPSPRITRPAELAPAPASGDAYARFARMVTDHIESGMLRFTARQRLMMLAGGMEIGQFKANLIIAEVLHDIRFGQSDPGRQVSGPYLKPARSNDSSSFGTPLVVAIILALLADLALLAWLLK